ncbi:segregation and condensation protein A [Brevundimonas vesicularis]|uniref:segregation and condensation protein A n=1 Tax=Brevundimonas vesicularis TaxID=41276 RepID=UPI0038D41D9B
MEQAFQPDLDFAAVNAVDATETFVVDLEGYEGPLHVLLALARTQKVDLLKLSITKLAEQYLAFVHEARRRNFAMAADYLVMASWLAFLKSRLLLPRNEKSPTEEPPAEEMAAALAFRLKKLEAMRRAVDALTSRPQLNRDVFTRGDPEATVIVPSDRVDASLYDLMSAYVAQRTRGARRRYEPGQRVEAFQLGAARDWLRSQMPRLDDWTPLDAVAPRPDRCDVQGPSQASYTASTLSASLELVKEGAMDLRQAQPFDEVLLKRRGRGQPLELTP